MCPIKSTWTELRREVGLWLIYDNDVLNDKLCGQTSRNEIAPRQKCQNMVFIGIVIVLWGIAQGAYRWQLTLRPPFRCWEANSWLHSGPYQPASHLQTCSPCRFTPQLSRVIWVVGISGTWATSRHAAQKSHTQKSQSLQFLSVVHRFSRKMQVLHILELLTVVIWKSATGQVKFRPSTPRTCVARWTSTWMDTPGLSGKREKHVMRKQLGYIQIYMIYIWYIYIYIYDIYIYIYIWYIYDIYI